MVDIEQSFWVEQKIKMYVKNSIDQGHKLNMRCFVCGDSKRNASKMRGYFYKTTCSYHCFNCDESLQGLNIVATIEHRPYKEVRLEYLQEKYGKNFKPRGSDVIKKRPMPALNMQGFTDKLPTHVFTYLQDRKIFEAPFLSDEYEFLFDPETDRLVIPWYYNDDIVYYQKRLIKEDMFEDKYKFPFNIDKTVFNIDMVDPAFPYIFILEGALDAIYVYNGVAIGGKNLTDAQKKMLRERWPKHKLVYFLDNHNMEKTGKFNMVDHLLKIAETEPSSLFLLWPEAMDKIKDVNNWITLGGKNIFAYKAWLEKNIISSLRLKFILSNCK